MREKLGSSSEKSIALAPTCPHLGLLKDVQTCYRTPSPSNYCHYVKNISPVNLAHQEEFCLGDYELCFVIQEELVALPKTALGAVISPAIQRKRQLPYLIGIGGFFTILLIIVLMILFGFGQSGGETPEDAISEGMMVRTDEIRPQKTKTFDATTTPNTASTLTPWFPTDTQVNESNFTTPTMVTMYKGSNLGTPIGRDDAYVVHQVAPNESMNFLLNAYHTNAEAFQYVNQNEDSTTLWVGDVLVMPYHKTELVGLHSLTAIYIDSYYMISDFCTENSIDELVFREYNDIGDDMEQLKNDQWVLLPYDETIGIRRSTTPTLIFNGAFFSPPLGPENEFLLHQVTYERNLFEVAYQYNSNEQVLAKLNGLEEDVTLILGQILIVQPDNQDVELSKALVKVHVIKPIKSSLLSATFGWEIGKLLQYNQLFDGTDPLLQNQWVIYPFEFESR